MARGVARGPGGVRGGKVNPPKKSTAGKAKSVSGSSQLIASSVSSGLVTNVARPATFRALARSPSPLSVLTPQVVGSLVVPLALQARGDFSFNNNVKISEIELLEKFEGGDN